MSILNEEGHIPLCHANVHYEAPYIQLTCITGHLNVTRNLNHSLIIYLDIRINVDYNRHY